uniref:Putative secreted protein n=1 Tax=Ixodes ricinus TaxID=34613 RepID=A0A147BL04_IXORI
MAGVLAHAFPASPFPLICLFPVPICLSVPFSLLWFPHRRTNAGGRSQQSTEALGRRETKIPARLASSPPLSLPTPHYTPRWNSLKVP